MMKSSKTLVSFVVGVGMGVVAMMLYLRISWAPRSVAPEIGGVFDVSFQSQVSLRPNPDKVIESIQEYEIATKWSIRNNSDKDIALAIPRQKYRVKYPEQNPFGVRADGVAILEEFVELPGEFVREEPVALPPHGTLDLTQVRTSDFIGQPRAGLDKEIHLIVRIGGVYQILGCQNRTILPGRTD